MPFAVAFVADLLFASNIEATLERAGYAVSVVEDLRTLDATLSAAPADVLILDLHAGVDAVDVLARCNGVPVLAFGRHTEPALLRAAREAGCTEVVPRSTFVAELTELVARVSGAPSP